MVSRDCWQLKGSWVQERSDCSGVEVTMRDKEKSMRVNNLKKLG